MIEFTYTSIGTAAAVDKNGNRIIHTNRVRLWKYGETVKYDRRYVHSNGVVSETAIPYTFHGNPSAMEIAEMIHWGCTGWSAGGHQITALRDLCAEFLAAP